MKTFSVDVQITQKHIDSAKQGDCAKCVVALAVIDAIAKKKKVKKSRVEVSTINWNTAARIGRGTSYMAHHPADIQQLISTFDLGGTVAPTNFTAEFKERNLYWE